MVGMIRQQHVQPIAKEAAGKYISTAWRKASAAWLQRYPVCVLCLVYGDINKGSINDTCTSQRTLIVDHIEPHRGDQNVYWDQSNWETLCRYPCHDVDKRRHEKRGGHATQWFELLRQMMRHHGTESMVREMSQWLPFIVSSNLIV